MVVPSPSLHWTPDAVRPVTESLVAEAPLALEISYLRAGQRVRRLLAVTMRTPGADEELAVGFLRAEGLIASAGDVAGGESATESSRGEKIDTWLEHLSMPPREDLQRVSRSLITSSACGLCGRTSLEGLPVAPAAAREERAAPFDPEWVRRLPQELAGSQPLFAATGGSHGAGLAASGGPLELIREDVGRHNAVDKLFGAALLDGTPTAGKALVLSGRASFELVQKAAAAGVALIAAVGAPSSLAVALAQSAGIALIGFARGERFNVYTQADRLWKL